MPLSRARLEDLKLEAFLLVAKKDTAKSLAFKSSSNMKMRSTRQDQESKITDAPFVDFTALAPLVAENEETDEVLARKRYTLSVQHHSLKSVRMIQGIKAQELI